MAWLTGEVERTTGRLRSAAEVELFAAANPVLDMIKSSAAIHILLIRGIRIGVPMLCIDNVFPLFNSSIADAALWNDSRRLRQSPAVFHARFVPWRGRQFAVSASGYG
jgi:hypothetical protein